MNLQLATVNLTVADPVRSKRFYVDVLGLRVNQARSQPPDFWYLENGACAVTIARLPAQPAELGFAATDVAAVRAALASHGIEGFVPQAMGWGDALEGHDPDGHRIIIYRLRE